VLSREHVRCTGRAKPEIALGIGNPASRGSRSRLARPCSERTGVLGRSSSSLKANSLIITSEAVKGWGPGFFGMPIPIILPGGPAELGSTVRARRGSLKRAAHPFGRRAGRGRSTRWRELAAAFTDLLPTPSTYRGVDDTASGSLPFEKRGQPFTLRWAWPRTGVQRVTCWCRLTPLRRRRHPPA
jgi:hypothetical protein